jgi:two-component system, chemotaxis family, protein-glutamate methylesterase/glutaminase
MTIRLMIVDDSAAIRGVYARMLEDQKNIQIVASVGDPRDAIKQIPSSKPDVVTMDVEMPGLTGLEALQQIRQISPATKVIMLSTLTQRGSKVSLEAERLGAAALLQKPGLGMNPAEFKRVFCAKLAELTRA